MVQPLWTIVWQLYIKLNITYHINQHSHSWPFIPEKCKLKSVQKLTCTCSEQLYLYLFVLAEDRNNPNVLQQVHGYTNYRTSVQWNTAQQRKGPNNDVYAWLPGGGLKDIMMRENKPVSKGCGVYVSMY